MINVKKLKKLKSVHKITTILTFFNNVYIKMDEDFLGLDKKSDLDDIKKAINAYLKEDTRHDYSSNPSTLEALEIERNNRISGYIEKNKFLKEFRGISRDSTKELKLDDLDTGSGTVDLSKLTPASKPKTYREFTSNYNTYIQNNPKNKALKFFFNKRNTLKIRTMKEYELIFDPNIEKFMDKTEYLSYNIVWNIARNQILDKINHPSMHQYTGFKKYLLLMLIRQFLHLLQIYETKRRNDRNLSRKEYYMRLSDMGLNEVKKYVSDKTIMKDILDNDEYLKQNINNPYLVVDRLIKISKIGENKYSIGNLIAMKEWKEYNGNIPKVNSAINAKDNYNFIIFNNSIIPLKHLQINNATNPLYHWNDFEVQNPQWVGNIPSNYQCADSVKYLSLKQKEIYSRLEKYKKSTITLPYLYIIIDKKESAHSIDMELKNTFVLEIYKKYSKSKELDKKTDLEIVGKVSIRELLISYLYMYRKIYIIDDNRRNFKINDLSIQNIIDYKKIFNIEKTLKETNFLYNNEIFNMHKEYKRERKEFSQVVLDNAQASEELKIFKSSINDSWDGFIDAIEQIKNEKVAEYFDYLNNRVNYYREKMVTADTHWLLYYSKYLEIITSNLHYSQLFAGNGNISLIDYYNTIKDNNLKSLYDRHLGHITPSSNKLDSVVAVTNFYNIILNALEKLVLDGQSKSKEMIKLLNLVETNITSKIKLLNILLKKYINVHYNFAIVEGDQGKTREFNFVFFREIDSGSFIIDIIVPDELFNDWNYDDIYIIDISSEYVIVYREKLEGNISIISTK